MDTKDAIAYANPLTLQADLGGQVISNQYNNLSPSGQRNLAIGATVLSPLVGGPIAAGLAAAGFGGHGLSDAQRHQNEMNDFRDSLVQRGGLSADELSFITNDMSNGRLEQLNPEQRLARYRTLHDSTNQDFRTLANQALRGDEQINQHAYDSFRSIFGREPTQSEYLQYLPKYQGDNGTQIGDAYLSELFDQYKQSPEYLRGQSGKFATDINSIFQQYLGRDATAAEAEHYGTNLAGGEDKYQLGNEIQALPEYQTTQDKNFRTGLASELEGYDQSFFNKAKENTISRLGNAFGGNGTSSALDFALTDLMGQIAEKRGSYLAGISAQQYGGNKAAARSDYEAQRNRDFENQDFTRNRNASELDYYRNRADEMGDYARQREDYYNSLGRQNQSRGVLHPNDWLNIGMNGVNAYAQSQSGRTTNNYSYLD